MVSKILIIAILLKARIMNNCNIFYSNIFQYIFTPIYFFLPLVNKVFEYVIQYIYNFLKVKNLSALLIKNIESINKISICTEPL